MYGFLHMPVSTVLAVLLHSQAGRVALSPYSFTRYVTHHRPKPKPSKHLKKGTPYSSPLMYRHKKTGWKIWQRFVSTEHPYLGPRCEDLGRP
ncbi:hypothetical protein F4803DRAFT_217154 [Xylaria telfairii]|nr:hypothetical protein F4803DRAFT_217154 [Xylaria telfairii]